MKLTKKEAIENHRKMWNWIAVMLKSGRYKAFKYTEHGNKYGATISYLKRAYLSMIGLKGKIFCDCFCCEYDLYQYPKGNWNCSNCPLVWRNGHCEDGEYNELSRIPYTPENLPKAVELARRIANLPERED